MRLTPAIILLLIAVGVAACGRSDPKRVRIAGDAPGAMANWRGKIEDRIPSAQWHEIDDAVQELRWSVKSPGAPANDPATADAVAKRVANCTFDEVLQHGYNAKIVRLEGIRLELKEAVDKNALMAAKDSGSQAYLDRYRAEQLSRLVTLDKELQTARHRLAELTAKPGLPAVEAPAAPDATPAVL
jgi:hypothetical protein